jgi:hypothetical protein
VYASGFQPRPGTSIRDSHRKARVHQRRGRPLFKPRVTRLQAVAWQARLEAPQPQGNLFENTLVGAQVSRVCWRAIRSVQLWMRFVNFIDTTKLLREDGAGPALLISPLLALMHNQSRTDYDSQCAPSRHQRVGGGQRTQRWRYSSTIRADQPGEPGKLPTPPPSKTPWLCRLPQRSGYGSGQRRAGF